MPRVARKPYAVEWSGGIASVLTYRIEDIRVWMLDWYVIYDSSGQIVARAG